MCNDGNYIELRGSITLRTRWWEQTAGESHLHRAFLLSVYPDGAFSLLLPPNGGASNDASRRRCATFVPCTSCFSIEPILNAFLIKPGWGLPHRHPPSHDKCINSGGFRWLGTSMPSSMFLFPTCQLCMPLGTLPCRLTRGYSPSHPFYFYECVL